MTTPASSRIAIIRRNGLGDLLCTMPLLTFLRQQQPEATLSLFVEARNAPLLPFLAPLFDDFTVFDKGNKYVSIVKSALRARHRRFDVAISAKASPMKLNNVFLYALGARRRIAVTDNSWHSRLINEPKIDNHDREIHQALRVLQLVQPGCKTVPPALYPKLTFPADVLARWSSEVENALADLPRPRLLVSMTHNRDFKFLQPESLARVLDNSQLPDFGLVISCEPAHLEAAHRVKKFTKRQAVVLPTATLDHFLVLLRAVDAVFIGEGGIMHMAAALNKPQLALFGKTKVSQWKPLSERAVCLITAPTDAAMEAQVERALKNLLNNV